MQLTRAIQQSDTTSAKRQPLEVRFFHLVMIFLLTSLVGLLSETIVSFVIDGRWESRVGLVIGPLSPIYGVGAVLFTVFLNPLRAKPALVLFLVAALVGGVVEYFTGWFFETRYGIVAWSYAGQPLNFHGHTCIGIMMVWGVIGLAWVLWALPHAIALVEHIPEGARRPLTAFLFVLIVADAACTLLAFDCWYLRASGVEPTDAIQQFFATHFDNSFMASRFETMSMWPVLAAR